MGANLRNSVKFGKKVKNYVFCPISMKLKMKVKIGSSK